MTPEHASNREQEDQERLFVIVPCFNEESGVSRTVGDILGHAAGLPVDVHVLLIDDGSSDGTARVMEHLCAERPTCSMVRNEKNLGVGRSVLRAYEIIPSGSWVTVIPGDNEIAFSSIDNYLEVRDRYDIILGYLQNPVIRTFSRRLASAAFTRVVNTLYGFTWRYLNGMKMYRVDAFKGIPVVSGGHAFMAELLAKAQLRNPHLRIGEVPFVWRGRARGRSKAIRPGSVLRAVREVWGGYRSVGAYRNEIIREEESLATEPSASTR